MIMPPRVRKLALVTHVISSVGWLGAVVAFLVVAVAGRTTQDDRTAQAAVLVMEPLTWGLLVPFAVASLVTGLVSSLGTGWGLSRHYWVLIKLVLNVIATGFLLIYTRTIGALVARASETGVGGAELRTLAATPILHAVLALVVLLAATVLAVFKPRGLTRHGWRKQQRHRERKRPSRHERDRELSR